MKGIITSVARRSGALIRSSSARPGSAAAVAACGDAVFPSSSSSSAAATTTLAAPASAAPGSRFFSSMTTFRGQQQQQQWRGEGCRVLSSAKGSGGGWSAASSSSNTTSTRSSSSISSRSSSSGGGSVSRPLLKPMRSVLYTPGSSRHLYKIREIACDVSLIDLEVRDRQNCPLFTFCFIMSFDDSRGGGCPPIHHITRVLCVIHTPVVQNDVCVLGPQQQSTCTFEVQLTANCYYYCSASLCCTQRWYSIVRAQASRPQSFSAVVFECI